MLNHFCLREPSAVRSATPTSISATVLYCMLLFFFKKNEPNRKTADYITVYSHGLSFSLFCVDILYVWHYGHQIGRKSVA